MTEAMELLSRLAALEKALPGRIRAAVHAVSIAGQHLARVLALRAAGQSVKATEISIARMALSRARRDAEDLQRMREILPAMFEQALDAPAGEQKKKERDKAFGPLTA